MESYSSSPEVQRLCEVCGDYSPGRHYGVWTCFGCRGFFQRTVRSGAAYVCRFQKNCEVMKKVRNKCRYCRFIKCLEKGMQTKAVQEERDKIGRYGGGGPSPPTVPLETPSTIIFLLQTEGFVKEKVVCASSIYLTAPPQPSTYFQDVYDSYKTFLHVYTDWAKMLPFFKELGVKDQLALIRAHGAEITALEFIRKTMSVKMECTMVTVTAQGKVLSSTDGPYPKFCRRLNTLIHQPFYALQPSDAEFILLKTLMLLDPCAKGLSDHAREKVVGPLQYQMQLLLEGLTLHNKEPGRLSTLLLLLSRLFSIQGDLKELARIAKRDGLAVMPRLVEEVIFPPDEEEPFLQAAAADTIIPVSISPPEY